MEKNTTSAEMSSSETENSSTSSPSIEIQSDATLYPMVYFVDENNDLRTEQNFTKVNSLLEGRFQSYLEKFIGMYEFICLENKDCTMKNLPLHFPIYYRIQHL